MILQYLRKDGTTYHSAAVALMRAHLDAVESHQNTCTSLANARMALMLEEWRHRFPTHALHILFGNGTEYIEIDGRSVSFLYDLNSWWWAYGDGIAQAGRVISYTMCDLLFVSDALRDVVQICDMYQITYPDDVKYIPNAYDVATKPVYDAYIAHLKEPPAVTPDVWGWAVAPDGHRSPFTSRGVERFDALYENRRFTFVPDPKANPDHPEHPEDWNPSPPSNGASRV